MGRGDSVGTVSSMSSDSVTLVETSEQPGPAPGSRVRSLDNSVML